MALNINGTTGISGVDGSASAPALQGTDSNTGINFASDTVNINTAGSTQVTVDSAGNVGVGTTNPNGESINGSQNLVIMDTTSDGGMNIKTGTSGNAQIHFSDTSGNGQGRLIYAHANDSMQMYTAGSERMRIDSSGRILLGTTSAYAGSAVVLAKATGGAGISVFNSWNTADSGTRYHFEFRDSAGGGSRGNITTNGGSTSYNTSSDYRLKENVTAISDGITRLKTLKPSRFNFIANPETTVDGFLAHEVTAVPEAISGTKDEVDSDNNPVYQGIDQSKLVPLLTAALQEAVAKIEVLETKVAALEAG